MTFPTLLALVGSRANFSNGVRDDSTQNALEFGRSRLLENHAVLKTLTRIQLLFGGNQKISHVS